jgi:hypothetical protein|tara:strand:- start:1250 stop:1531 length:282 start_codon:yes stop_codon:yes gene_type:complete
MTWFLIILSNLFLYAALRIHLVRKFRTSYSIYLKDDQGNRQTLTHTIAHLLEANEILEKKIMYLANEMEKQWISIEQIKVVTGAERYCTEKHE